MWVYAFHHVQGTLSALVASVIPVTLGSMAMIVQIRVRTVVLPAVKMAAHVVPALQDPVPVHQASRGHYVTQKVT